MESDKIWERLYKLIENDAVFMRRANDYSDPCLWGEIEGGYWVENLPKLVNVPE